ncbi:MAG: hypothetical protein U5J64_00225 [Halobacteriales archaeon]|nr:hypothetical protein [Halobacteriales archaeon]
MRGVRCVADGRRNFSYVGFGFPTAWHRTEEGVPVTGTVVSSSFEGTCFEAETAERNRVHGTETG